MSLNPILICARTDSLRGELEAALDAAGYETTSVATPAEAVAVLRRQPIDLVVADGPAASGRVDELRTADNYGRIPILVVVPHADDVEARIAFLEAGADDVIVTGFAEHELEARITALLVRTGKARPEAAREQTSGEIVAFFSPKGGVGTTTLAVNAAVLLAGGGGSSSRTAARPSSNGDRPASRVLLIDLDLQFGQVATHLNLTPRYDLAGLASDEQALDDPELARSHLIKHVSGLTVLAAPTRPEAEFGVTLDRLQQIVEIFSGAFDLVIVDLGSRLDPRTLWILEQADVHVFTLFPEIAALRATSLLTAFLAEATPLRARTHIVVNHIFPKPLLKTRDLENLLRVKPTAEIPFSEVDMIRAVNEGVPLVMSRPSSPAGIALRRLAQAIIGAEVQPTPEAPERRRRAIFHRR